MSNCKQQIYFILLFFSIENDPNNDFSYHKWNHLILIA